MNIFFKTLAVMAISIPLIIITVQLVQIRTVLEYRQIKDERFGFYNVINGKTILCNTNQDRVKCIKVGSEHEELR